MVGLSRLELLTSRLSGVRSNQLSYRPMKKINYGGDEENRTPDPLLARQVLSQLSYAPMSSRPIFAHLTSLLVGRLGRRSSATTPGVSLQAPSHLHKSVPLEFAIHLGSNVSRRPLPICCSLKTRQCSFLPDPTLDSGSVAFRFSIERR